MSILFEKSGTWRWLVRRTKESKPFFLAFATICGVVPGVIGYGVMQVTNTRNPELEARLRQNARPETLVRIFLSIDLSFLSCFFALDFVIWSILRYPPTDITPRLGIVDTPILGNSILWIYDDGNVQMFALECKEEGFFFLDE
ncbi:hypothetical protein SLA2020_273240 [Shorea laevis]